MGLSLRTGIYGNYWGNDYHSSNALNKSQMEINANDLQIELVQNKNWTLNALCGILGNMQAESSINPRKMARK